MSTSSSTVHRAAVSAALSGAAVVLAVAPAYAGPFPVDGTPDLGGRQSRAQGEHGTGTVGPASPRVRERRAQLPDAQPQPSAQPPTQPATRTPDRSGPSDVPVTVIVLLGGTLLLGATGFSVYRYRHHGPAGAATA